MDVVDEEKQVRYPSLASTLVSARLRKQSMAEELRVLYVAMTRAKEHLIGVGTCKADAAEEWEALWSTHEGRFPPGDVVGASCMLDWLGPVAAAMKQRDIEPIRVISHSVEEVKGWPTPESLRPSEGERQRRLAQLQPLDPAPAPDKTAADVIARLTVKYAFESFTKIPAVEAATTLTKTGAPVTDRAKPQAAVQPSLSLELPRAVRADVKPTAADVGAATHLLLEHLDFASPCDISNLESQISDLVDKRLLAPAAAKSIDLESIRWLMSTPVGKLLREHAGTLRRELPIYFAMPAGEFDAAAASSADPQDRIMIRSRIDVLVQPNEGLELVDYKTDRAADVELYRGQMGLYRRAIESMTGRKVTAVHLVFLSARQIETM
jgi:ATP-dependent helicase/nuclease subunit A